MWINWGRKKTESASLRWGNPSRNTGAMRNRTGLSSGTAASRTESKGGGDHCGEAQTQANAEEDGAQGQVSDAISSPARGSPAPNRPSLRRSRRANTEDSKAPQGEVDYVCSDEPRSPKMPEASDRPHLRRHRRPHRLLQEARGFAPARREKTVSRKREKTPVVTK